MLKVDTDGEFIFFKEKFIMDTYLAEHAYLGISVKSVINDVVIDDAAFLQGEDIIFEEFFSFITVDFTKTLVVNIIQCNSVGCNNQWDYFNRIWIDWRTACAKACARGFFHL